MSLTKSWYTFEEATDKYGVSLETLRELVELGLIRYEEQGDKTLLLNGDDIELEFNIIPAA